MPTGKSVCATYKAIMFNRGSSLPILLGSLLIIPTVLLVGMKALNSTRDTGHPYRMWADNTGRFSAWARLQSDHGNSVVLERQEDGEIVTIPLARLSPEDRRYLLSGEEGDASFADLESADIELFPFSLGQWNSRNPGELWVFLVDITPLWATLAIPLGVGVVGYLLFLRSRSL